MFSRPSSRVSSVTLSPTLSTPSGRRSRLLTLSTLSSDKAAPSTVSVVKRAGVVQVCFYESVRSCDRVYASGPHRVFHDDYGIWSCFWVFCIIRETVVHIWGNQQICPLGILTMFSRLIAL